LPRLSKVIIMLEQISDFIQKYYIAPIIDHTGYNAVNTATYAVIALIAAYVIWTQFKKHKIKFDRGFFLAALPYILLGSTMRVVTDSIDTGVMQSHLPGAFGWLYSFVIGLGIYNYGFVTSSPGIYIVTAGLLFLFLGLQVKFKKENLMRDAGLVLWLAHLLVLLPMFHYLQYFALILLVAGGLAYAAMRAFASMKMHPLAWVVVAAHSLDGTATFVIMDIFNRLEPACTQFGRCYFEQHVLSNFLGSIADTFLVYLGVKVAFSALAAYLVCREAEGENELVFILLLLSIFGLAPGLRNLLRITLGA